MTNKFNTSKTNSRQRGFSLVGLTWLVACVSLGSWMLVRANAMQSPRQVRHTRAIEDVKVGDWVLAKDQNDSTSPLTARKVEATFVRTATVLQALRIESVNGGSQELKTTDEHPFWVDGSGWVKAGDLKVGQKLVDSNGQFATLSHTTQQEVPEGETVFNFRVGDAHTYFVSAENSNSPPVWAHNAKYVANKDPKQPRYNNGKSNLDHKRARSLGGSNNKSNLQSLPSETNFRKGGFEGQLGKDWQAYRNAGMTDAQIEQVLGPEINSLGNSPPPRPLDPQTLDNLPSN